MNDKIIVLQMSGKPEVGNTKYVDMIHDPENKNLQFRYFSWKNIFISKYDILHFHWPELHIRSPKGSIRVIKSLLMVIALLRAKLFRIKIIRTLHNPNPHEGVDRLESFLLSVIDKFIDQYIVLNPVTKKPRSIPSILIKHGDYRADYSKYKTYPSIPGRIVYFGFIRPYKGLEKLIETFHEVTDGNMTLSIFGRASTPDLKKNLENLLQNDPRISADFKLLPDECLAKAIYESELVVLPYHHMHNSGALLLALSLGRCVLAPVSDVNLWIQNEVGSGWLQLYSGELSPSILVQALDQAKIVERGPSIKLEHRSKKLISDLHFKLYSSLLSR